jgi:transcriptional regulator with XRE-family HTH domain
LNNKLPQPTPEKLAAAIEKCLLPALLKQMETTKEEPQNMELGKFLEHLRGDMSLRKAAEVSGLSHTYIRDLELGINRTTQTEIRPTPETLSKLASAYNYQYEELMKRAGYLDKEFDQNDEQIIDAELVNGYILLSTEDKQMIKALVKRLSGK